MKKGVRSLRQMDCSLPEYSTRSGREGRTHQFRGEYFLSFSLASLENFSRKWKGRRRHLTYNNSIAAHAERLHWKREREKKNITNWTKSRASNSIIFALGLVIVSTREFIKRCIHFVKVILPPIRRIGERSNNRWMVRKNACITGWNWCWRRLGWWKQAGKEQEKET